LHDKSVLVFGQWRERKKIMSYFKTMSVSLALALGLMFGGGCGDDPPPNGNGGNGGTPDIPGPVEAAINSMCQRFSECNQLADVGDIFIGAPISRTECVEIETACVDESFLIPSLQEDWALLVQDCLDFSSCAVWFDCWLNTIPSC
jgi:hypothetical protein